MSTDKTTKPPVIIGVYVQGGVVQGVRASRDLGDAQLRVYDFDDARAELDEDALEAFAEEYRALPVAIY